MSNELWFLVGFCSGVVPCAVLAVAYYVRALRRVRSIQRKVEEYHRAQREVSKACDRVYPKR